MDCSAIPYVGLGFLTTDPVKRYHNLFIVKDKIIANHHELLYLLTGNYYT